MATDTRNAFTTQPTIQPTVEKDGQLSPDQMKHFFEKGWLLIEDFIDREILESVKHGISKQVDELAQKLFHAGKIKNKHEDKKFFQRMIHIEKEFPDASVLLHKTGILPDGVKELWCYDRLLNVGEQIIGPEISGHPVWNLRVKPPEVESGVVPWHQDNGYFTDDSLKTMILTAWIPLLDTTEFNGGMQMLDGTQSSGALAPHFCCAGGTFYLEIEKIDMEETFGIGVVEKRSVCDVPYGGVLLFNNMVVHRSTTNRSLDIRWSMDMRWQDPRQPNGRNDPDEKMPIMRSMENSIKEIDWSVLKNRQKTDRKEFFDEKGDKFTEDEFDTRIGGPWMKRWPIKHHNKHTEMNID